MLRRSTTPPCPADRTLFICIVGLVLMNQVSDALSFLKIRRWTLNRPLGRYPLCGVDRFACSALNLFEGELRGFEMYMSVCRATAKKS